MLLLACSVLAPGISHGADFNISGNVRQEIAYSLASNNNELNQMGNVFNARITPHYTHAAWGSGRNARAPSSRYTDERGRPGFFQTGAASTIAAGLLTRSAANCRFGQANARNAGSNGLAGAAGFTGILCPNGAGSDFVPATLPATRGAAAGGYSLQGAALNDDINFNLFNIRSEIDVKARFSHGFSAFARLRVYADGTSNFTDGRIGDLNRNPYWGRRSTPAEWSTPNVLFDLPALYLDYHNGPLWIRLGNQTVAWGEAYFFRVMDVANGLDLRRHLTLGPGGEEFQDQRIASPTLRVSYAFDSGAEVDFFASLFTPSVLPPQNSAYSLISSGTTLDERDEFDDAEGAINFGVRLSFPVNSQLTVMAMYANRRNPDGVFRYTEAPAFNGGFANAFCAGPSNATNQLLNNFAGGAVFAGGPLLAPGSLQAARGAAGIAGMPQLLGGGHQRLSQCGAALAPDAHGPGSTEFWHAIGRTRLDPIEALTTAIDEWPATHWAIREIFGFGEERNVVDALRTMEGFHSLLGGFRAYATREFKREQIFSLGANYIIQTEDPNSFFDSMILRGEVAVTPDKAFTSLGLSRNFIEETEIISALIVEKFHRFSNSVPATYMVWQWMHREASDLFGRHLSGTESIPFSTFIDPQTGDFTAAAFTPGAASPKGSGAADYVVFGFQQPTKSLRWRFDLALLVDVEGGYLVQPGLRFRPSDDWQFDLYANFMEDGGDENDDIMESLDFADEIFVRVTHLF